MKENAILKQKTEFAGYKVVGKLSSHHSGEREVYEALDSDGHKVALTVFDLKAPRYAVSHSSRKRQPDFIEEVRFYKQCAAAAGYQEVKGFVKYLGSGISTYRSRRYGWVAQEFVEGYTLEQEIIRQGTIPQKDCFEIFRTLSTVVDATAIFTHGGGHYNISTDNIIVRYDKGKLVDVRLIGFSNIGTSYSGNTPIEVNNLDKRFQAPETYKGIFSNRSDIYSVGMVLLIMLIGYPKTIMTDKFSVDFGSVTSDTAEISAMDYYNSFWRKAEKGLTSSIKLVLQRAIDLNTSSRFATMDKFRNFVKLLENKLIKTEVASEDIPKERHLFGGRERLRSAETKNNHSVLPPDPDEQTKQKKALDDVAGMAQLKALFRRDFIRIVRNPKVAQAYGIQPSNCTLLYGPQGCGKTFIAEKAAQESGLKYKIVNPSELGSIYIHGAQQKIAELFQEAEKNRPMILIFDEIDAVVPKRDSDFNSNQANEVNEMLTQLNNCASRGIYVLATTNRPGLIDAAIMRKGRVDRTIYVSLPDKEARKELFRLEIEKRPFVEIDYEVLAAHTDNYTCSDISFIVEESARLCFEETLDRNLEEPLPLSMNRLLEVIKQTQPSVSESQRKEYQELRAKMENRQEVNVRKKVGFLT